MSHRKALSVSRIQLHSLPYTNRAKRILDDAHAFSNECGSLCVNTEHLICVLARPNSRNAVSIHNSAKLLCSQILSAVLPTIEIDNDEPSFAELFSEPLLSPNVKKSLENAMDIANELNHFVVNPEHLMLGILSLDSDTIVENVKSLNSLNFDDVYNLVVDCSSTDVHCGSRELNIDD